MTLERELLIEITRWALSANSGDASSHAAKAGELLEELEAADSQPAHTADWEPTDEDVEERAKTLVSVLPGDGSWDSIGSQRRQAWRIVARESLRLEHEAVEKEAQSWENATRSLSEDVDKANSRAERAEKERDEAIRKTETACAALSTSHLAIFQKEVSDWAEYNFGADRPYTQPLMGLAEELGELNHALLKQEQGIRGTYEDHEEADPVRGCTGTLSNAQEERCRRDSEPT
jgi:hypothetical protein